jgi:DNA-binding transcriptional LysR family regulator
MIVPAKPLAVSEQVAVLEATSQIVLDTKVVSDNIQLIVSLVQDGNGIGMLTSLDVITEVGAGLLAFTPIAEPVLRPMTLALCTATARPTSYAADIVLREMLAGFGSLGVTRTDVSDDPTRTRP